MELPIKIDLSRLSYPALLQLIVPLVPGGVIICGALLMDLGGARSLAVNGEIPIAGKVVMLMFSAYVIVGLVLHMTTNAFSALMAGLLVAVLAASFRWMPSDPWKSAVWRKTARQYLGPLAPVTDAMFFSEVYNSQLQSIQKIEDTAERNRQLKWMLDYHSAIMQADFEWSSWYWVLLKRFPEIHVADAAEHSNTYMIATLYSTGWTIVILLAFSPHAHWLLWTAAVLSIILGTTGDLATALGRFFESRDQLASHLTARILIHLEQRDKLASLSNGSTT